MTEVIVGEARLETPQEAWLREWFEQQHRKNINTLEAGARQIITLVSTFYGLLFGILSLGSDKLEASLHLRAVLVPGTLAIFSLLIAIIAALGVILPLFGYQYNPDLPAEQEKAFGKLTRTKLIGFRVAVITFGFGITCFAWFIGTMLYFR